jgi:signal transduction histidine kinase
MTRKLSCHKSLFLFLFCFIVSLTTIVNAKNFDEKHIKSAYMVNFFKHITWPNETNKSNYHLAIYKEPTYFDFLAKALKDKKIKNKNIRVSYADNLEQLKRADSVYIPQQFNGDLNKIANVLRGSSTLIISDNSLNKHDVMINLIQQGDLAVISFEVNKSNIIYEKLQMSADLLLLGGSELDIATLYRKTEMAMQKTREKSINLQNNLLKQQQKLASAKQVLKKLNIELSQNAKATELQKSELAQLKLNVIQKQQQLEQQRLTLSQQKFRLEQVTDQSTKTADELFKQQSILAKESIKNNQILVTVAKNKKVLKLQEEELAQHKAQLKEQNDDLISKKKIISNQQTYLLLTTILTTLAILAALLIIFFFNKNKKTTQKLTKTLAHLNETQEQLIQSEKMASLGRLVAGVAHEINTPLSIAITANSLVLDDTVEIKEKINSASLTKGRMDTHIARAEQSLVMSENALERVKNLLVNFKLVAADQIVSEQREINVAKYINEVMSTLSVEMKKRNITYQCNSSEQILITTIPGVFSQVISNLVMNSLIHGFDDMSAGDITMTIFAVADQNVEINYCDTGKGMDEHTLENIFEPFFTTKRGLGSTGLGMNIVYNLVNQQLKGLIKVSTEQGVGTFIKITLPITI